MVLSYVQAQIHESFGGNEIGKRLTTDESKDDRNVSPLTGCRLGPTSTMVATDHILVHIQLILVIRYLPAVDGKLNRTLLTVTRRAMSFSLSYKYITADVRAFLSPKRQES
jgi:hypothetical protein